MVHGGRVDIAGAKLLVMDKTRSFIACGSEGIGKRGRKFSVCQVCIYIMGCAMFSYTTGDVLPAVPDQRILVMKDFIFIKHYNL